MVEKLLWSQIQGRGRSWRRGQPSSCCNLDAFRLETRAYMLGFLRSPLPVWSLTFWGLRLNRYIRLTWVWHFMWLDCLFQHPLEAWSMGTSWVSRVIGSQKALYAILQCVGLVLMGVGEPLKVSCRKGARKLGGLEGWLRLPCGGSVTKENLRALRSVRRQVHVPRWKKTRWLGLEMGWMEGSR